MITIVDYGAGNLRSVVNAIATLGYTARITSRPDDIRDAQAVILPGVGAAADAMRNLKQYDLIEPLRQFIRGDAPSLGSVSVCRFYSPPPKRGAIISVLMSFRDG